jgi:hypothetical protein
MDLLMRFRCLSIPRIAGLVFVTLVGAALGPTASASAQDSSATPEETPTAASDASTGAELPGTNDKKTSVELRFTLMSPSARWSAVDLRSQTVATHAKRSLYVSPGLGVRVFIRQPHHGLLVDWDYRIDTDMDSINSLSQWKTDFSVAHVG